MQIVPLAPVPNQAVSVTLNGQNCQINVVAKATGVFVDLYVANSLVIGGVIARNLNLIVLSAYLGFIGDLMFIDNQGWSDPTYTGLGTRYSLAYLTPADIPATCPWV